MHALARDRMQYGMATHLPKLCGQAVMARTDSWGLPDEIGAFDW